MPEPDAAEPSGSEDEEAAGAADNSLGRLLTLCDGVFAIAITLLTFDLKVPDVSRHVSDSALRHALAQQGSTYLSFGLSFFVIARLWGQHRRIMRAVVASHPRLIRETVYLLFVVASMPFLSDLLGTNASKPTALGLYSIFNATAILLLMQLDRSVRKYDLMDHRAHSALDPATRRDSWRNVGVFLLAVPAGYLFAPNGAWVLVLLAVPTRVPLLHRLRTRHRVSQL